MRSRMLTLTLNLTLTLTLTLHLRPQAADAAVRAQDHEGVERRCGELLAKVRVRVRVRVRA